MKKKIALIGICTMFIMNLTNVCAKEIFPIQKTYENGQFSDVDETVWYGAENQCVIKQVYEQGIMDGMGNSCFEPEGNMRICEAVKIAAVINNIYNEKNYNFEMGETWYQSYVDYSINNGIIQEGEFQDYNRYATREEMAHIFAGSVSESELAPINTVNGILDVYESDTYATDILKLYRAGIVTGSDEQNHFFPLSMITRAEAAAIISRIINADSRATIEILPTNGDNMLHDTYGIYNEAGYKLSVGYQQKLNLDEFLEGCKSELTKTENVYGSAEDTKIVTISENESGYSFDIRYLVSNSEYIYIQSLSAFSSSQYDTEGLRIGDTKQKLFDTYGYDEKGHSNVLSTSEMYMDPGIVYYTGNEEDCMINYIVRDDKIDSIYIKSKLY